MRLHNRHLQESSLPANPRPNIALGAAPCGDEQKTTSNEGLVQGPSRPTRWGHSLGGKDID